MANGGARWRLYFHLEREADRVTAQPGRLGPNAHQSTFITCLSPLLRLPIPFARLPVTLLSRPPIPPAGQLALEAPLSPCLLPGLAPITGPPPTRVSPWPHPSPPTSWRPHGQQLQPQWRGRSRRSTSRSPGSTRRTRRGRRAPQHRRAQQLLSSAA